MLYATTEQVTVYRIYNVGDGYTRITTWLHLDYNAGFKYSIESAGGRGLFKTCQ